MWGRHPSQEPPGDVAEAFAAQRGEPRDQAEPRDQVRREDDDHIGVRMGGMALANGLLLQSPRYWAAAVRKDDGSIEVQSGEKFGRGPSSQEEHRVPLVRGLIRLAEALSIVPTVRSRMRSAVLPYEEPRMMAALGVSSLATWSLRRTGKATLARELAALGLGLAPVLAALRGSPTAGYHGAEHKSIGEYENVLQHRSRTEAGKEHDRCGSNLVGPLLATSLVSNALLRRMNHRPGPATTVTAGLLSTGVALEVFRWMSRHPGSKVAAGLGQPGRLLQQFFTTKEPTPEQMEVAYAALAEILRLEGAQLPED